MEPVTTFDSFKGVIVLGLSFQLFACWMIGLNNNALASLSFYANAFQIFFPMATVFWLGAFVFGHLGDGAHFGFAALWLFDLVVGALLTTIDYRRNPQPYLEIRESVGDKLHRP